MGFFALLSGSFWATRAYHRVSLDAALKKTMVERGMTPEEIRLVMDVCSKGSQDPCKGPAEVEV